MVDTQSLIIWPIIIEVNKYFMEEKFQKVLDEVEHQILTVAIIDLDNVAYNYHKIKNELAKNAVVSAVVKGNSYGFGAVPISERLYKEGCRHFFVATINEGIEVRNVLPNEDAEIFVLSGVLPNTEQLFLQYNLIPVLNNWEQYDLWMDEAKKLGKKLDAIVHVDTGMSRNGFMEEDEKHKYANIRNNLNLPFVMSHLACADDVLSEMNQKQLQRFREILKKFGNPKACLSATNGIFLGNDYQFDMVRPGKGLYGFSIREDMIGTVKPVMDIFSRIVQVNHLKKGDTVGYGSTFTADKDMTSVTIGMGYSDGFMRKFSGFGYGFLGGQKLPMIGRISMDYIVLDASSVDEKYLELGDWVALTRSSDYTLEKWALELGTIPHEISCRLGERVKRIYIGEQ